MIAWNLDSHIISKPSSLSGGGQVVNLGFSLGGYEFIMQHCECRSSIMTFYSDILEDRAKDKISIFGKDRALRHSTRSEANVWQDSLEGRMSHDRTSLPFERNLSILTRTS